MATTGDTKLNDLYIKDAGGRNPNPNFPHAGFGTVSPIPSPHASLRDMSLV